MLTHVILPGSDLELSRIALGTMHFGGLVPEKAAFELMDVYWKNGGNILDTALIYSDWISGEKGRSEKTVGRWLKSRRAFGQVFIGTKGGHPRFESMHSPRLSKDELRSDLENSLRNLDIDAIDLYWLHRDDESRDMEEILDSLDDFVKEGKIRYYGCSNFKPNRVKQALSLAEQGKVNGFVSNQLQWSMAVPNRIAFTDDTLVMMDQENYVLHESVRMPIFAFSSQAGGYLSILEKGGSLSNGALQKYDNEHTRAIYTLGRELAEKYHTDLAAISLAFLMQQTKFQVIPIVGSDTPALLQDNFAADTISLTEDDIACMNKINIFRS